MYFFSPDSGFAVGGVGRIQHTNDGGKTWSEYATTYHSFTGLSFGNDSTGYACTSDQVYKTVNKGKTWQVLDLTSGFPHGNYGGFQKVHFINADTGLVPHHSLYTGHLTEGKHGTKFLPICMDLTTYMIFSLSISSPAIWQLFTPDPRQQF